MWRRALATMVVLLVTTGVATASTGGTGPRATGGSHLITHNVFGLETLVLQHFGFGARLSGDGSDDGWFDYRDVEDGAPFSAGAPVTA